MKVRVETVEDVKDKLKQACEVHKSLPQVRLKDSRICILGFIIPSHLWSSDAEDMKEVSPKIDVDEHWYIFDNWFKGLDRREKLIVLFKSFGIGNKRIEWILKENYCINACRATIWNIFNKAILKIFNNAR